VTAGIAEPGAGVGYAPRVALHRRIMAGRVGPVVIIVLAIIAIWYVGAFFLNAPFARDMLERGGEPYTTADLIARTMNEQRPVLPSPHQVAQELWKSTFALDREDIEEDGFLVALGDKLTSKRSLTYHAWVTLSSALLGFVMGTVLGIVLAVAIVHSRTLSRSLMPWVIASQTVPILAIAPMVIVVLASIGLTGLLPKSVISTYLSFFPVTVGMVKGLRSPDPMHLDLMRTYHASQAQIFWKLRWPSSVPFLFASMKVAVAISLVGAIVGELPTGAVAGLGARLLTGSYYGQTVQIWSALITAAVIAAVLVTIVGIADRVVLRRMGELP
jgi:NitT/TauT family transport system permease protein